MNQPQAKFSRLNSELICLSELVFRYYSLSSGTEFTLKVSLCFQFADNFRWLLNDISNWSS